MSVNQNLTVRPPLTRVFLLHSYPLGGDKHVWDSSDECRNEAGFEAAVPWRSKVKRWQGPTSSGVPQPLLPAINRAQ